MESINAQSPDLTDIRIYWEADFWEETDSLKIVNPKGGMELELYTTIIDPKSWDNSSSISEVIATNFPLEGLRKITVDKPFLVLSFDHFTEREQVEISFRVSAEERFAAMASAFRAMLKLRRN